MEAKDNHLVPKKEGLLQKFRVAQLVRDICGELSYKDSRVYVLIFP